MAVRGKKIVRAKLDDGRKVTVTHQAGWFLQELKEAGRKGITKADYPGLHVGDIVMRLRDKLGESAISTVMEPNHGPFGGEHGRYRLVENLSLEEIKTPKKAKASRLEPLKPSNSNTSNGKLGGSSNV